jgi:hypothetical protein
VFRAVVVFTRWKLCCLIAATMSGWLLPQQGGHFSFEYCSQFYETSSGIHHWLHFGRLACHPTPTLSLCVLPHLCLVLVRLLWEIGLLPHPCSQPLLLFSPSFKKSSLDESLSPCPTPVHEGRFSISPYPCCQC